MESIHINPRRSKRLQDKVEKQNQKSERNYVYKACRHSIVTLELLSDSKTTEARKDVSDSNFAKFRTNKVRVISLIDPITGTKLTEDTSIYDHMFKYKVNEIITEQNFDLNINSVCSRGIHYFKTRDAALAWYYDQIPYSRKKDGIYYCYYDNGQVSSCEKYKNDMRVGEITGWYMDGTLKYESFFLNDAYHGERKEWYIDGTLSSIQRYKNGKQDGMQEYWYPSGQKMTEENYVNDMKHGRYIYWNEDGTVRFVHKYINGKWYGKE